MAYEPLLTADDYRRLLALLEVVERATSVEAFGESMLAALEEQFGYRISSFFLAGPLGKPLQPERAAARGMPAGHIEGWTAYWGPFDPLNCTAAFTVQRRLGVVDIEQVARSLDRMQRRYVEEFLLPNGIESQLAFHVDTGLAKQGYGSLASRPGAPLGPVDHARVAALRPHLANLLRRHLSAPPAPAPPRSSLTPREAQVADLVAQGLTNRQVASMLNLTEATVKQHVTRVLAKLGLENRTQLALVWRVEPGSGQGD